MPERGARGAVERLRTALAHGVTADRCGFFFDFDGTLAPIQLDPAAVAPVAGSAARLAELSRRAGRVALVSARPASFLASQFPDVPDMLLFGLYGLESATGGSPVTAHPAARARRDTMAELVERARAELPPGASVEDKRLTVALHYRAAPERADEVTGWARAAAAQHDLVVQQGRMVVELKPPGAPDKGSTIIGAVDGLDVVWYFGDDVGDIPAFRSLRELAQQRTGFVTTLVAVHNPETGADLEPLADAVLGAPADIPGLLDQVLAVLR